jgi:uncharacterized protein (TIGR03067 family)
MNKIASLTLLAAMLVGCAIKPRYTIKPSLQGHWSAALATVNGRVLAPEVVNALKLTITKDRYKTERGDEVLFDSTYLIDTSVKPNQINMLGTEGAAAGKEALGIYSLEGDFLRICYVMPGSPRPTTFASATNSGAYLVVWRRDTK